jgi:hypothetical protein
MSAFGSAALRQIQEEPRLEFILTRFVNDIEIAN